MKKTATEIHNRLLEFATAFTFDYKNKHGGVDPFNDTEFDMWYGDTLITVCSIDEVMNTPIFDGKSLTDIVDEIDIDSF